MERDRERDTERDMERDRGGFLVGICRGLVRSWEYAGSIQLVELRRSLEFQVGPTPLGTSYTGA